MRKRTKRVSPKLQRGFSIVTAIFLLVVLSFLGVAMVTFSTSQHQSAAMDVMGSRAYQAARAGVEWAAFKVTNTASGVRWTECPADIPATAVATTLPANSMGGTLAPFAVTVTCGAASGVEGASTVWVYDVTATATTGGAPGAASYIERVLTVKLGR